ncbi:MAG: GNAT family N-acetyltransferase [Dehalococcoidia bacterium]|nr:GNAT family N-acetyltransferase [Dehalococcoidia bacterium]
MTSALHLARMHLDSLFALDADGRIASVRDPEGRPAARFHLVRTGEGNLPLVGVRVSDDAARQLFALAAEEPPFDGARRPRLRERYISVLEADGPLRAETSGPGYVLPDDLAAPDGTALIERGNADLLAPHFQGWLSDGEDTLRYLEARSPVCVSLEDGAAVSVCMSARLRSAGIEASLETAEPYRRRGHALRAVAAWAAAIRVCGSTPLYSTSWDNLASQAVAARLGARQYGADFSLW